MPRKTSVAALLFAGLQMAACSEAETPVKAEPATVEHVEGTDFSRVILTPKAAERLGIETVAVREIEVMRKRTPAGEIVPAPAEEVAAGTWVRVGPLNESDLQKVDRSQPALVLAGDDMDAAMEAMPVEAPAAGDAPPTSDWLYYVIESAKGELKPGQRVRVETPLAGSGGLHKVVPHSSLIYGAHGESWVYTSPEPLTYVRHPVVVDYVEDDLAVLSDGPAAGTEVVSVGVAELFGTEFEVGH
jgi:hypothetical protein